ncbi:MAG: DUF72 domain-containing protein [Planctomycetes bacterium]|nr:DUF72 domain-containing protein [Planctomycetota bacterium]
MGAKQRVLFGTSGWSYEDWKGTFYPRKAPGKFDYLGFAARYFDALEINSTFYRPPSPRTAASWVRRTADREGFEFTAKLHQRFTHQRSQPWTKADADVFKSGIDPLAEAGKLGGLLMQFPWSFRNTSGHRKWLEAVIAEFREYPLFLEVRHKSWQDPEILSYLGDAEVGLVDVDQPLFPGSLEPGGRVTAARGYVRLHGRNRANWFRKDVGRDARYDYLYSEDELKHWVERIRSLAKETQKVFVFNNNHYQAQAAANSLELKSLLTGERLPLPGDLLRTYPRLEQIGKTTGIGETQGRLL